MQPYRLCTLSDCGVDGTLWVVLAGSPAMSPAHFIKNITTIIWKHHFYCDCECELHFLGIFLQSSQHIFRKLFPTTEENLSVITIKALTMSSVISYPSKSLKQTIAFKPQILNEMQGLSKFQAFPWSFTVEVFYFQTRSELRKSLEKYILLLLEDTGQKLDVLLSIIRLSPVVLYTRHPIWLHMSRLPLRSSTHTDTSHTVGTSQGQMAPPFILVISAFLWVSDGSYTASCVFLRSK